MTALKTGDDLIWACVALLVAAGAIRVLDLQRYLARKATLTSDEAAQWHTRYQFGALVQAAAIGTWCSVALTSSNDAVVHMICLSVTTGNRGGRCGESLRAAVDIPSAGFASVRAGRDRAGVARTLYYVAMSAVSAAFLFAIMQLSANLHRIFMQAVVAREREAALATQFDTALNNMPHGLCMFTNDGCLAVLNHRFSEMMNLPGDLAHLRPGASDILSACVDAGSISAASAKMILSEIANPQAKGIITTDPDVARGRSLSWAFQPMADGGAVVLLEDVTERRNAEARITHLARYDELTGLPNRTNFRDEIEHLLARPTDRPIVGAAVYRPRSVQAGQRHARPSLRRSAVVCGGRSVAAMLRPEDFVARFGGDEFVVFQQNIRSPDEAAALARRIVDHLSERYKIDNHLVEIGASIGIAMAAGVSADTLLKNADMALYRAKADGRGTFCFFRDEMAQTVAARRILELDLRKALANEEFELFYQPLVNLQSGRISTCEALLRWNHPVRGTVSPIDIIPVAEDMGMIVDLGRWILRKACLECMRWPEAVSVAVNFSPQQFHQRDLLSEVRYALDVSGLPPHRLEIEITEIVVAARYAVYARRSRSCANSGCAFRWTISAPAIRASAICTTFRCKKSKSIVRSWKGSIPIVPCGCCAA